MRATITAFVVVAATGVALAAVSAAAATQAPTPQALYKALVTNSVGISQLPGGFASPTTSLATASGASRRHHVVGEVEISIGYGNAVILYAVFPTRQDAVGDWEDVNISDQPGVTSQLAAAGFPSPALIVNGSVSGMDAVGGTVTSGFTSLAFVDGNVSVAISTHSTTSTASGNMPATIALGKFADSHLHTIEKQLAVSP